jgi:transcriptional regulator with XRE-family HTH domain
MSTQNTGPDPAPIRIEGELDTLAPFGAWVKSRRTAAGLSQAGLATKTGIAQATVSKIEDGRLEPSFDVVRSIARGMGEPLVVVMLRAGLLGAEDVSGEGGLSLRARALAGRLDGIPDSLAREAAMRLVEDSLVAIERLVSPPDLSGVGAELASIASRLREGAVSGADPRALVASVVTALMSIK